MSPLLKMQKRKGIFQSIFRAPKMASGELVYFFVATECKQPPTTNEANQYLVAILELARLGPDSAIVKKENSKMAVAFDSAAKDRVELIGWASQAFAVDFKTMVTDFFLFFGRFEHTTGNGKYLVARRPA
jgi:hypothetical protein